MAKINSLAYFTDIALLSLDGKITYRENYIRAESPDNPSFYWGNFLLFKNPPAPGDSQKWPELFRKEFNNPKVKHLCFGWDSPSAEEGAWAEFEGFTREKSVTLTATVSEIKKPKAFNTEISVRALSTNEEWKAALDNQIACRHESFSKESYTEFKENQMIRYRRMVNAGLGHWYGAFLGNKLIADCGLFIFSGIGRYQTVGTNPEFRNRGACSTLIHQVAERSLHNKAQTLVIVADQEYHAAKIYESVGLTPKEKQIGMFKRPE